MTPEEFAKYDDELNRILKGFHISLFNLINMAEQIDPKNYHIEWVKKQISIALKIDKENIIKRMKDKMWDYRNEIMACDIAFFKNNQFSKHIKNDDNRPFMYSFLNMIKKKSESLSKEEINSIWEETKNILLYCIEYKRLVKDYDE
jgi:hypothetical protein